MEGGWERNIHAGDGPGAVGWSTKALRTALVISQNIGNARLLARYFP